MIKEIKACRLKNYLQIEEVIHLELYADCYVQTKELCEDLSSICRLKKNSISRFKSYMKIKKYVQNEVRLKKYSICRLKNSLQIKWLSANWWIICKSMFDLQMTVLPPVESPSIRRYVFHSQTEHFFDLQIVLQSADNPAISR